MPVALLQILNYQLSLAATFGACLLCTEHGVSGLAMLGLPVRRPWPHMHPLEPATGLPCRWRGPTPVMGSLAGGTTHLRATCRAKICTGYNSSQK